MQVPQILLSKMRMPSHPGLVEIDSKHRYPMFTAIENQMTRDLYIEFSGEFLLQNFLFGMVTMTTLVIPFIFSGIEECIIKDYIPEFKGTYDDRYDELLAVDWSVTEEIEEI